MEGKMKIGNIPIELPEPYCTQGETGMWTAEIPEVACSVRDYSKQKAIEKVKELAEQIIRQALIDKKIKIIRKKKGEEE